MGPSGKWLKSLIGFRKLQLNDQEKKGGKSRRKWRLWRSSSVDHGLSFKGGHVAASEASDSSPVGDDTFTAAVATVAQATPKDFMVVRQEWAAIRIQTAFRAFLARRALRALKALVRLQALVRGRQVRKQAAETLRCMQALVRVQARVKAQSVRMSSEGKAVQKFLNDYQSQVDPIKQAEERCCNIPGAMEEFRAKLQPRHDGAMKRERAIAYSLSLQADPTRQAEERWCNSPGTREDVRAKLQMTLEGALKREKAIAYSLSQRQLRSNASSNSRLNKPVASMKHQRLEKNSSGWGWLERWMAAKPWENRLMEVNHTDPPEMTPISKKSDNHVVGFRSDYSEQHSANVRRNNVTTRISAKPPMPCQITRSSSDPSSECLCESSSSTSSLTTPSTSASGNTHMVERMDESISSKPSYMNLTESIKAKQRVCKYSSNNMQRHLMADFQIHKKSIAPSKGDTRGSTDSNPASVNLCKDLYPPMQLDRYDWAKSQKD